MRLEDAPGAMTQRSGTTAQILRPARTLPGGRAVVGALLMLVSLVLFFFLPWLDRSPVKSIRYKGMLSKIFLTLFTIAFLILCYMGMSPPNDLYVVITRVCTVIYFAFFLLMPWYTRAESCKTPPSRVTYHA